MANVASAPAPSNVHSVRIVFSLNARGMRHSGEFYGCGARLDVCLSSYRALCGVRSMRDTS